MNKRIYTTINKLALALEDLRNYGAEREDLEKIKDNSLNIVELETALTEANADLKDLGLNQY